MAFEAAWSAIPPGGDALHRPAASSQAIWTTVNAAEVFPGVPTPLTWAVCGQAFEIATRTACVRLGALPRTALPLSSEADERFFNIWFGRATLNVSLLGQVANAMPGSSAAALERAYFGGALEETSAAPERHRYPVVAARMPVAAVQARRRMRRLLPEVDRWWRGAVANVPETSDELLRAILEASDRLQAITTEHVVNTMIAQGVFDQLETLAARAGCPEAAMAAVAGVATPETQTIEDLRRLAAGDGDLATFVATHGFHGPAEGELASRTWREDTTSLLALIDNHRRHAADARPPRDAAAAEAAGQILRGLPPLLRPCARPLIAQAREYMRLRETGRTTLLRAVDACRAATRALGQRLAAADALVDADDVFFLLPHELRDPDPDVVAARREARDRYQKLELPDRWHGSTVEPQTRGLSDHGKAICGVGASAGQVEGPARVIHDPDESDIEPGEILVCHTTDPGWASYFELAAAVVIDVGAKMSHGAIVAREVGIPCVIGTKTGTQQIRTGDQLRVDGTAGAVEVLAPAAVQEQD